MLDEAKVTEQTELQMEIRPKLQPGLGISSVSSLRKPLDPVLRKIFWIFTIFLQILYI